MVNVNNSTPICIIYDSFLFVGEEMLLFEMFKLFLFVTDLLIGGSHLM